MKEENLKQVEFGKLSIGSKFYLNRPNQTVDDKTAHTKILAQKSEAGAWSNAKNNFGLTTFVQYDKRVWIKA